MKTTGIGSLPHHNVDSALEYSFRHDIPFLPQLPLKNPQETMVYQTLFGFPGLMLEDKKVVIDLKTYVKNRPEMQRKLESALKKNNYEAFLPTHDEYSAFTSFLFELTERKCTEAKVQVTGHMTSGLVLTLKDGENLKNYQQILNDVYQWTHAKAMALVQVLTLKKITPLIFIDEPILTIIPDHDSSFVLGLAEIEMMVLTLKKAGATVGLHSCGNTNWSKLLGLSIDYLSFDVALSGAKLKQCENELKAFLKRGGKLSLGILPTDYYDTALVKERALLPQLSDWKGTSDLLTCACGLGFKTPEKSELFLNKLNELKEE